MNEYLLAEIESLQAEIERLRDALKDIDDLTGFDYPTMPEVSRAKAHEITREILECALTYPYK
jgi:hypothetical protein